MAVPPLAVATTTATAKEIDETQLLLLARISSQFYIELYTKTIYNNQNIVKNDKSNISGDDIYDYIIKMLQ